MNAQTRQQFILDHLEVQRVSTYETLRELLGVSSMTVRRDVDELASNGEVIKTIGGVQKTTPTSPLLETALVSRLSERIVEKRAIAAKAVELIGDRRTIYLDGGTTCIELARRIAERYDGLTIVTNSAMVCMEIGKNSNNSVIGIGGEYDGQSMSFLGPASEEWISRFHVDVAFLSTKGFVPKEGTFESTMGLIRIKQIVARQSGELILLADHTKFGQRALCKVLDPSQVQTIVTDDKAPRDALDYLKDRGHTVHIAAIPKLAITRKNKDADAA